MNGPAAFGQAEHLGQSTRTVALSRGLDIASVKRRKTCLGHLGGAARCQAAFSTAEAPAKVASATPATPAASNGAGNGTGAHSQEGPVVMKSGVLSNMPLYQLEVVNGLAEHVDRSVLPILKDPAACWQPADFLPSSESPDFLDEVAELRKRSAHLPDDFWVVLVGDLITEEALPTYMAMLNTLDGVRDETGAAPTPWGRWTRQWTAEENRHGDVMTRYAYLTGRVNMKAIEYTTQRLIGSGMDPKTDNNPYLGFIYTSFQERATKVSHGNTAAHAAKHGDKVLGKILAAIAGDEARHERAYTKIVDALFERDPSGAVIAFNDMMTKQIVMPAHLMDDGSHVTAPGRNLFKDFSAVAQTTGAYTSKDYIAIFTHLVDHFRIRELKGLTTEAQKAQEAVLELLERFRKLTAYAERLNKRKPLQPTPFSWIFQREVPVLQA